MGSLQNIPSTVHSIPLRYIENLSEPVIMKAEHVSFILIPAILLGNFFVLSSLLLSQTNGHFPSFFADIR